MSPVTVVVIPEGASVTTLGELLGPPGALALVAGFVTVGFLVVALSIARGRTESADAPAKAPSTEPPLVIPHLLRPCVGVLGEPPIGLVAKSRASTGAVA